MEFQTKNAIINAFIFGHVVTLQVIFTSSYDFDWLFSVLPFYPVKLYFASLLGKSSDNKLPQLMFICECVNISLIFEEHFSSYRILVWKVSYFFQHFKCYTTVFWPPQFHMRNLLLILLWIPYVCYLFSCWLQNSLYFWLSIV